MALFASGSPCAPCAAPPAVPTAHCGGCCQQYQYTQAPVYNPSADVANRYSQQVVDNRNDIVINQPVINNRDHYVNNVNTQLIRDNNHYHHHTQHYFRENVHNRFYNQVFRQTNNFFTSSTSSCCVPGVVTHCFAGTTFSDLGCCNVPCCASVAPCCC